MNESGLNALINLFAIFSIKGDQEYEIARKNLEAYLFHRLGVRNPDEYISLFYEIFDLYSLSPQILNDAKTLELIQGICNQLKSKISHAEQLIVFLHFLELASKDLVSVKDELYQEVANIFEIKAEDYHAFKQFIYCLSPGDINDSGFLVVNNKNESYHADVHHICKPGLSGEFLIYYIAEIQQFVFRYFGEDALFLEGHNIHPGHFYSFTQGSIIRGQAGTNIYYTEVSLLFFNFELKNPLVFSADRASYFFPGTKNGIQKFTFSERSGQIIAVMGGSGVGKSTLLNVLNGSLPLTTGKIFINEFDIHQDFDKIEGLIGYIPQDDLVMGELTVFQNVYYNALLCLDHMTHTEISESVDQLLKDLDLYDRRDMVVGSPLNKTLSGGQRKRLNIALELIREPSILFVDEPTSGLSSKDSEKIMVLLKQQAQQGRLVIVNIHQPSSFIYRLFDKLWILDKGGFPIYSGNPLDAILYFKGLANHIDAETCECKVCGNVNPEQVLEIIETQEFDESGKIAEERKFTPEDLNELYVNKIQSQVEIPTLSQQSDLNIDFHKPHRFGQFLIFFKRNLKAKLTNRQYIIINLLQAPLLAVVVSLLTRYAGDAGYSFGMNKNFPSFLFMSVIVMLFQGMSLSAEEIIRDRTILQRESFLRLSRFSYLNSKVIFLLGVSFLQSFLFVGTSFLVLDIHGLMINYWAILFLTAAFANLAGLNLSAGLSSVVAIYISIPLLIIPQILLCGLIVSFDDLQSRNAKQNVVPIIGDLMVSRWAFEALAVNQFTQNKYTVHYFDVDKEISEYFIKGELLIPDISSKIQTVSYDLASANNLETVDQRLRVLAKEIRGLDQDGYSDPFLAVDQFNKDHYNRDLGDSAMVHLEKLRDLYKQLYRSADSYKDQITSKLIDELGQDALLELKEAQYNNALASIVIRENLEDKFTWGNKSVFTRVAPIYRISDNHLGRAHFYAPYKQFGSNSISTYYFNLMVIILMSLVLYVSLYYNWLGRTIDFWGKMQSRIRE